MRNAEQWRKEHEDGEGKKQPPTAAGPHEGVGPTECHISAGRCSPPVRARTADFLLARKGSMRMSYFRRLQFASWSGSLGGTNMERRHPWHGSFCAEHGSNQSLGRHASSN